MSAVCKEKQVIKLDWFDDLLKANLPELLVDVVHPNDKGHEILTNKIIEFLNEHKLIEYCL